MNYFILLLIGAILVPAGDIVHVLTQTTSYNPEQMKYNLFEIIPFWVPILFGAGGLGAGVYTKIVRKKFKRVRNATVLEWVMSAHVFLGMYFLSGFLPKSWIADLIIATCGIGLYFFAGERSLGGIIQAVGIMIGGTLFEVMLVQNGIFSYTPLHNELFGVAPWLPWLYLGVAISADSFFKWSKEI